MSFNLNLYETSLARFITYPEWCVKKVTFEPFERSIFVGSAWSFVFSSPPQRPMTPTLKDFYTRSYTLLLKWKQLKSKIIFIISFFFNVPGWASAMDKLFTLVSCIARLRLYQKGFNKDIFLLYCLLYSENKVIYVI